jgi:outer membrane protein OmpA-like peptidoglycan-associated protein
MTLAQSVKVEGLIKARNGDTMILKTKDSPNVTVLLTDSTQVGQVQGVFKARRKEMSMAALIPGLAVKVEGSYNDQSQLVAKSVSFKGNDLEQAEKIEAGMHETRAQAQQNKAELEKHKAELQKQNVALQEQQQQIAANKAAIDDAVARFGQLDEYYILDEVTVNFGNGKVKVDPSYRPQLLALAEKAKTINGYVIEVKGYASSVGSVALNQQLSEDRADEVVNILRWEKASKSATTRRQKNKRRIAAWSSAFCRIKPSLEYREPSIFYCGHFTFFLVQRLARIGGSIERPGTRLRPC